MEEAKKKTKTARIEKRWGNLKTRGQVQERRHTSTHHSNKLRLEEIQSREKQEVHCPKVANYEPSSSH